MQVNRIRALRGPNLWTHHTAIQTVVDCSAAECNIAALVGFEPRLRERFPEISPFQATGHDDHVSMARVLELATLGLQAQAGCPVTFSCTTPTVEQNVFQVVVEYSEEEVGKLALELAQQLCQAALNDTPFDLQGALEQLRELVRVDARHRDVRSDAVDHERQQQEDQPATQVAELAALGQLSCVGCH